ncbi:hypothetical protein [Streptomyces sp. NPDC002676]
MTGSRVPPRDGGLEVWHYISTRTELHRLDLAMFEAFPVLFPVLFPDHDYEPLRAQDLLVLALYRL